MARLICKKCGQSVIHVQVWREVVEIDYDNGGVDGPLVCNGETLNDKCLDEGDCKCDCATYGDLEEAVADGLLEIEQ
jgi:hypothetical protein